jgi:hypothetical protein
VWLAKRELGSRRVRSRPFTGIDPTELDLARPRPRARRLSADLGADAAGAGDGVEGRVVHKRESLIFARDAESDVDAGVEVQPARFDADGAAGAGGAPRFGVEQDDMPGLEPLDAEPVLIGEAA